MRGQIAVVAVVVAAVVHGPVVVAPQALQVLPPSQPAGQAPPPPPVSLATSGSETTGSVQADLLDATGLPDMSQLELLAGSPSSIETLEGNTIVQGAFLGCVASL